MQIRQKGADVAYLHKRASNIPAVRVSKSVGE